MSKSLSDQSHLLKPRSQKYILPPPAAFSAPSVARYVSASRPVVGVCTPLAPGAAAPGGAAGGGALLNVPCSPAAAG